VTQPINMNTHLQMTLQAERVQQSQQHQGENQQAMLSEKLKAEQEQASHQVNGNQRSEEGKVDKDNDQRDQHQQQKEQKKREKEEENKVIKCGPKGINIDIKI